MAVSARQRVELGVVAQVRQNLDGLLSRKAWRRTLAFLSGLATFVVTTGGLFVVAPNLQSALIAGIAIGLVAHTEADAAAIGGLVAVLGLLIGPDNYWLKPVPLSQAAGVTAASIALCAAVAASTRLAGRKLPKESGIAFVLLAGALLVANLWYTPLKANSMPFFDVNLGVRSQSFDQQLASGEMTEVRADGRFYFEAFKQYKRDGDYYATYDRVFRSSGWEAAESFADFRMPTLFWLWALLPTPRDIVAAYLLLASLAVLSVIPISAASVRLPLAIPGCAALAAYFAVPATQVQLFQQEPWAAAVGVCAVAAYAVSTRSRRWRMWTVAGVALAVLAVLVRETAAMLVIAGVASSFVGLARQRRFRSLAWAGGVLVLAVAYAAQYLVTKPYIVSSGGVPRAGRGGVQFMLAAFHYGTELLGGQGWLQLALALVGIVAVMIVPDVRLRVLASVATLATIASFMYLGNGARAVGQGSLVVVNYWGLIVLPLLYAFVPTIFVVIPGAAVPRPEDEPS